MTDVTANSADFERWQSAQLAQTEAALSAFVRPDAPAGLGAVMRYAVLDGGKRLRPLLVHAASTATGGLPAGALRAGCAVELIHAYSLVHDDMPCMDNDVLRRGKPTVHVQFGQAQALLAGDALQALAFELLTPDDDSVPPAMQAKLCQLLARSAGHEGMAGGQAIDLAAVGQHLNEAELCHMHKLKTGALLYASVMMGAACGTCSPVAADALGRYGWAIGLAFQVVDDILDVTGDAGTLGKTAGKDAASGKPTYVSVLGMERSQAYARELHDQAQTALRESGLANTQTLAELASRVIARNA